MQSEIITEAGTVIGIYDPKDEHSHLTRDSEVVSKAAEQGAWDTAVGEKLKEFNAKAKARAAAAKAPAKKGLRQIAADAMPKSTTGKAAMVAVPAAAALAASETSRGKIKAKYDASRDVRHYRPASPYYDDGFGKALSFKPKWLGDPAKSKTVKAKLRGRSSIPLGVGEALKEPASKLKTAVTDNPGNAMTAASLAATGIGAAGGAVKAAMASRKAAKLKVIQDAKRARNVRDAALVGSVAAPVALGTHLATRRKVEKADVEVEKGVADTLKNAGKKLKKVAAKGADPTWQQNTSKRIADLSGDAARTSTNVRSVINDAKKALIPKSMQKPQGMSTTQKIGLGAAGVGGLMIGRELTAPKPYPYQQQR